jgi:hypothetical protein
MGDLRNMERDARNNETRNAVVNSPSMYPPVKQNLFQLDNIPPV